MTRNFPSFLDAFVDLYEPLKTPDVFKYWTAMATLAGALERKVWWTDGIVWSFPNLYLFLIGERSTGKSTIASKALDMLWELDGFDLAATQLNEASLIATLAELGKTKTFEFHGKHYKNSSLFLFGSEGAKLFGDMGQKGQGIINTLTDLYNSGDGPWSERVASRKATRSHGNEDVFNPCLNLFCCSTINWLMTKILTKSDIEGGFGSRMIYAVYPHDTFEHNKPTEILGPEHFMKRAKLIEDLKVISKLRGPLFADKGWLKAYDHYHAIHAKEQKRMRFTDPVLQACLSRKANSHLSKISILLAIDDGNIVPGVEMRLKEEHAHKAWELLSGLEETMPEAFGRFGVSDQVREAHEILRFIILHDVRDITVEKLSAIFSKQFKGKVVREAIGDLRLQGHLIKDPEGSARMGKTVYMFNSKAGQ